jgi:hypothetical protein
MIRMLLVVLGICVALIGLGLLYLSYTISSIDSAVLLSQDRIAPETLAQFHFTPWCGPQEDVRPFVSDERSFNNCEILRYRRGTRRHWLVHYTYYEAEYQRRDGSRVTGPAVGPRPYAMPNFFIYVPLTIAGVLLFVAGLVVRSGRGRAVSEPQLLGMVRDP